MLYLEFMLNVSCTMALFIGRVVGTKMQKTAKVEVTRLFLHPQVLKVKGVEEVQRSIRMIWCTYMCMYMRASSISTCTSVHVALGRGRGRGRVQAGWLVQ